MEAVFISRICKIWFVHLSLSLEFEYGKLLRYSTFNILRLSSIGASPPCKLWFGHLSLSFISEYDPIIGSTLNFSRLSSVGGRLRLKDLLNMVWSSKLKFEI